MPRITFIESGGERSLDVPEGLTIMQAAVDNGIDAVEGTCGGALACATCHVIVDPDWAAKLPRRKPDEEAMLDFADGVEATSRLGCQIPLTADLDGIVVRLPEN